MDVCPDWLAFILDNPIRRMLNDPDKILDDLIQPGMIAADLGCGPGVFTFSMARLVGERGRVYAVDIQKNMLDMVRRKALQKGLLSQVILHEASTKAIGLPERVDFALAFWMVHEVPDSEQFIGEVYQSLQNGGKFLLVEPKWHVSEDSYAKVVSHALSIGFKMTAEPKINISRASLFTKKRAHL
jgi:ubiquinone/menaquinone biosynthesis C-methylase UbiE